MASDIRTADLLLCRPTTLLGRLIARTGRSEYSHAAMIVGTWNNCVVPFDPDTLWVVESFWPRVRKTPLREYVERWPGVADWHHAAHPEWCPRDRFFSRSAAGFSMLSLVGRPYGLGHLAAVACRHLAGVRLLMPSLGTETDDLPASPFCSEAIAWATRQGGVDPVPNCADQLTEPADLSRSLFYRFCATLVP